MIVSARETEMTDNLSLQLSHNIPLYLLYQKNFLQKKKIIIIYGRDKNFRKIF